MNTIIPVFCHRDLLNLNGIVSVVVVGVINLMSITEMMWERINIFEGCCVAITRPLSNVITHLLMHCPRWHDHGHVLRLFHRINMERNIVECPRKRIRITHLIIIKLMKDTIPGKFLWSVPPILNLSRRINRPWTQHTNSRQHTEPAVNYQRSPQSDKSMGHP